MMSHYSELENKKKKKHAHAHTLLIKLYRDKTNIGSGQTSWFGWIFRAIQWTYF